FSILIAQSHGMVIANKVVDNVMVGLVVPLIVIAHHRTVFLAAMLGLFILFELHERKLAFALKAILASAIVFTAISVAFIEIPRFENIFLKAVAGLADPSSDHTGSWRIEAWYRQVTQLSERELLLGKGLGSYYSWYMTMGGTVREVKVDPHDAYVQIILKFGLLGLVIYAVLAFSFLWRMFSVRKTLRFGPPRAYMEMSLVNFGAAHAFMSGYSFALIILVWYAIGITAVKLLQDGCQMMAEREDVIRENLGE